MERLKSLRSSSYRHLIGTYAADDDDDDDDREEKVAQDDDVVLKIDEAQQRGKWTANARTVSRSLERRARAASTGFCGVINMNNVGGSSPESGVLPPRVKLEQSAARKIGAEELEQEQGKPHPCLLQECSYDLLAVHESELPWHEKAGQLGGNLHSGNRWRAQSLDFNITNNRSTSSMDSIGDRLLHHRPGSQDADLNDVSVSAQMQWPLKQPLPKVSNVDILAEEQGDAAGHQLSKEMSALSNSSRRFSHGGSGSTSSSSGPAFLTQAPLFTTDHLLSNFTENPTFSPAATEHGPGAWSRGIGFYGGFKASRFGRAADTKQNLHHATVEAGRLDADEMRSLRSRRSNSDDLSQKVTSFVAEDKSQKSASNSPRHYNRMKSRFSEPPRAYQRSEHSGSLGRGGCSSCSGKLRSGQLKSGQLKSSQLQSGLISPHMGMLGQIDEEECAFENKDLPDKPSPSCKWSYWVCLEWILLLIILGALACSIQIPWLHKVYFWELQLWKWILLLLVVFCGRLLSGWAVWLLVFGLEHNFLMRKHVVYFVYVLWQALKGCIWLALVLIVWHCMFNPHAESAKGSLVYISKVLLCFLIAATLFVIKVFMLKILASWFHVVTYFYRIRDSLFNQYVLETLSGPPVVEIQQILHDEQKLVDEVVDLKNAGATAGAGLLLSLPDPVITHSRMLKTQATLKRIKTSLLASKKLKPDSGISVQHLHKMNQQNVSAWNMKRLIDMVRHTSIATLTHTTDNSSQSEESEGIDTEIRSEWQAKAAAKQIFKNVAREGQKFVDEEDLMRFMQAEETIRALALFDGAMESGKITKQALKNWVVAVYRERRALALSLSDMDSAVKKLHRIVDVVLALTVLIVWLLILGISPMHLLLFVFSQMLLTAFLFGNMCKTLVEAIIFMFIIHPFDVGDRCVIDGIQYVVEEMNILTTVFLREAKAKVWIPNSELAKKLIQNFYRSPEMGDGFEFVVHASTPAEKIATLKEQIGKYIASKPNHWNSKFSLVVVDLSEGGKMKLSLGLSHTINYQDFGEKVARRSELMWELKRLFEELKIEYHLPPQEVHLRTLTDLNLPD